ncbi:CDP-alcohol phosphatidyltransferase family protein [Winogradskyella maritima]|uniref:CDP-alcohol phosphatidyltransferase family protein n=1 Tax=Winogradskyella maritima TaxID=1517766 RepID=A0ABV8AGV4_9FLAO|nr:CDP-alcohol phosphatidyltransferase family protein [Winogradskyella maritima]
MNLKRHIPNFVTLLNLMSGCIAVLFAVNGVFDMAALFVFLGIFFDFFDGLLARKLNVQSPLGIQLDSLADMVTSGLVPGIVMYKLIAMSYGTDGFFSHALTWDMDGKHIAEGSLNFIPLIGLFITLASAYRLAKFNLDEDQQTYFKGLPTPANAIMILSLPLILNYEQELWVVQLLLNPWFLIILTLISCYLLNANVKLFALKFKNWSLKDNMMRYGFLITVLVLLFILKLVAIPLIIFLYILLSLFNQKSIH